MRKKHEEAEPENSERWTLTYLDMITLLFVLFVVLYSMANVNINKFKALATSMSMAFSSGGGGGGNMIANYTGSPRQSQSNSFVNVRDNNEFKSMVKLIKEYAAKQGISKKVNAKITERGLVVNLEDSILFQSGSAELSSKAQEILDHLAEILFATKRQIRVEGYTDNQPIHTARYESNWQLSTDRATNVIIYWISRHPDQAVNLSAAGYGEYKPVASNDTPEGRTLNRRVDLVILRETASHAEEPPNQGANFPGSASDKSAGAQPN